MAKIELNTSAQRANLNLATHETTMAQIAIRDYLDTATAELASDEYIDLRHAARNAEDRQDAAYLAWKTAERAALAAWHRAMPGDVIETVYGSGGILKARGSIAGWVTIPSTGKEVRVEFENVRSITRD